MSGQKRRDSQGQGGIRPFQAVKNPFDRFIAFWAVFRSHRTCCRKSTRLAMGETLSEYDFMTNDAFQSTRPSRGETSAASFATWAKQITIHSPLAGRDRSENDSQQRSRNFNPPAPRGARRPWGLKCATFSAFQSTRPSRGETPCSHAGPQRLCDFNPLAPRGARHEPGVRTIGRTEISIHSPLAGRDGRGQGAGLPAVCISIHSPLAGRDYLSSA